MPKHKIDVTHVAVNRPSSLLPENHKYADTAKEISTAIRMNISETLTIDSLLWTLIIIFPKNPKPKPLMPRRLDLHVTWAWSPPEFRKQTARIPKLPMATKRQKVPNILLQASQVLILNQNLSLILPCTWRRVMTKVNPLSSISYLVFLSSIGREKLA